MDKIKEHKKYIQKIITNHLLDDVDYTTKYCKQNKLFISMISGDYSDRNIYTVIDSGILKIKKEINGTSKNRCKLYIKGSDLKSALKTYYNL